MIGLSKLSKENKNGYTILPLHVFIQRSLIAVSLVFFLSIGSTLYAQTEVMPAGSFIINMGVTNQTVNNSLRPYGMIYDLTKNYQVPIRWVINPSKAKDGVDFTFNGVSYKGGTFVIPAPFRTAAVNSRITFWQGQGVVGVTTNAPVTVPVYAVIGTAIRWTLDATNGEKLAKPYLDLAQIPSSAYNYVSPQNLGACNDVFVMPHAEPQFSTHSNLVTWNNTHRGWIWVGCKAGSETENNVGKFLSVNGLITSKEHPDLQGGVTYTFPTDPVMQFLGTGAHLASANGAEEIYHPRSTGWRSTTRVGIYQTSPNVAVNLRKAILAWGPGFGDTNRGLVCMHAGHSFLKIGTNENSVAAIRAFHNFSLLAAINRTIYPVLTGVPDVINAGVGTPFSYTLTPAGGSFSTQWSSSCGGTFSPSATSANVTYTPPAGATSCVISVRITDACGRVFFTSKLVTVQCVLNVTRTVTNVSCNGGNNGSIAMTISGSPGPYSWNWSRVSPAGTSSGSGNTISNLIAGSYNVTVTSPAGCRATFTNLITQPNILTATPTVTNYNCFGQTGSVSLAVGGGTPSYTYSWTGPSGFTATTQNITNRTAGIYTVTVTDSKGCTRTTSATITGPATAVNVALTSTTNVNCDGQNTGAINITASGGTPGYTYLWNNGATTEDRTGLASGTYSVTVTDSQGCTGVLANISINVIQNTVLAITTNNISCAGGTNGNIQVTASGVAPFNINWSGPVSGNPAGSEIVNSGGSYTISNLSAGTYNVSVTDNNNCTAIFSRTLTAPATLVATPTVTNYDCFGQTGSVSLTVSGGTTSYMYSWSGPGGYTATTQNITNRPAGTYNVTVTDSQGCTATTSATITGPTSSVAVTLNSKTNIDCNGNTNGAINITASGGTPGYTYAWSDGSMMEDRTGLAAGSYTVTVTDANGCTGTRNEVITQPASLVLSISKTDPTCPPGANAPFNADGTITVTVTGGTTPYSFVWSDGPTTQNRTGLSAGTYTVTVTDANGCNAIQSVTLNNILPLPDAPGVINNN